MLIVHVKWVDAVFLQGWLADGRFRDPLPRTDSVGVLVYDEDAFLSLSMSVGETNFADVLKIPHSLVIDVDIVGEIDAEMV